MTSVSQLASEAGILSSFARYLDRADRIDSAVAPKSFIQLEHSPLGLNRDDWGIPLGVEMGESAFPSESGGAGCREAIPLICVSV